MPTLDGQSPVAEVRAGRTPDLLVLVARTRGDRHAIHAELRAAYPSVKWRLSAEGVTVSALQAGVLRGERCPIALQWTPAAERMLLNRAHARARHDRFKQAIDRIYTAGRAAAEQVLGANPGLRVLDDHQWVNVACMTLEGGYGLCVFDEQGAGKTVTGIFAYDVLVGRDEVDRALIVAPKSMVGEWPNDFYRFTGERYVAQVVAGTRPEKKRAIASAADVLVTNFETLVLLETELRNFLARFGDRAVLIVDESFYAKNLDARRTLAVRRLREWCGRAFVLCGTPAPNKPHDLVQQFNIVDFGLTFEGVSIPEDRDAARPVVQQTINRKGLFVRHRKSEVLPTLPRKSFNRVLVQMGPIQARLYRDALDGLIRDLGSIDDETFGREIANFLARRSALLQICSNPVSLVPGYTELPCKLTALDDILTRLIDRSDEKTVVWSFYTASIDAIVSRYGRYRPVRYDGKVADVADRRVAVKRFQEDDETMLFVGNPAAAGAGLTLHRARVAVYESMSNQAAHYLQSLDRIHRRGQERNVEYTVLLCRNTIEESEYQRLLDKERAAADLLGDHAGVPPTRELLLEDLLRSVDTTSDSRGAS